MKKVLKILGIFLVIVVVWYGARWAYYVNEYKQHNPRIEIAVNGLEREYYLFTPANETDGPSPLLVTLQGGGADAGWRFASQYDWEALAEEEGMIIALPSGKQVRDNEGAWQLNTDSESMQDIDYFEAMISEISSKYTVDASRIYAAGYSLGSMFSYELACQMSTRFAAIASFAGTMPVAPKSCNPERNIPIMHIHGVEDPIIAYANTWDWKSWDSVGTMQDIPSLVQYWQEKYNCQNANETSNEAVAHFVYDACDQDSRIEHYRLENGTHDWPADINGEPTYSVMWSFLSKHSLP
jgi:polyhydroxybutyrate depolymerase